MRIRLTSLLPLLSAVLLLSSCLKDDDDSNYEYYTDTGISAFTLGTMNQYLHTTSSAGADSVYKQTYAGSAYKFTIDQLAHRIYNTDSLPYGTDASHVIATITAINSGYIYLKTVVGDTLSYYSSTDSIDFTQPRTVRIVSQDGTRYADYTVTVNVRQVPAGTMDWRCVADDSTLAALDDIHAAAAGNYVFVFGTTEGGSVTGFRTSVTDGTSWTPIGTWPDGTHFIAKGDRIYAIASGCVISSADGEEWSRAYPSVCPARLIAASTARLYGFNAAGTAIMSSADNGSTWSTEAIDGDSLLLPSMQTGFSTVPTTTNDSIDRVMIVGYSQYANDAHARAWTKFDDYSAHPVTSEWSFVNTAGYDTNVLDALAPLSVTTFDGAPLAIGISGSAVTPLYRSLDGGITWKNYNLDEPDSLPAQSGKLAITTDSAGSLWIIAGGQVWKN